MDIENVEEHSFSTTSPIIPPPSKSLNYSDSSAFEYCNELNSFLVDNGDSFQVLNTLKDILSEYNDDIDIKVDYKQKVIEGLVFISNYSVFFTLYIWAENANQTRFEFRRTSGDAMASAKLWAEIKEIYQGHTQNTDFISLDLEMMDNENNMRKMSESQLNQLTESLVENDLFVVDELNDLYEAMGRNQNIAYDVLSAPYLMQQLINKSLLNDDVCVTRIVLLILEKLAAIKNNNIINMDKLWNNINVLLHHKRPLIRKYTMRLLAKLSTDTESEWKMDDMVRKDIIDNIKKNENIYNMNIDQEIINKISRKVLR